MNRPLLAASSVERGAAIAEESAALLRLGRVQDALKRLSSAALHLAQVDRILDEPDPNQLSLPFGSLR